MLLQYCDRMIMKTNLRVIDGKLVYPSKGENQLGDASFSVLNIKPTVAEDGGFIFYDKEKPHNLICQIAYEEKRGKSELCYETQLPYRSKGYMTEAMAYVLQWFQMNAVNGSIWLLIDKGNLHSLRIARKFHFAPSGSTLGTQDWYYLELGKNNQFGEEK